MALSGIIAKYKKELICDLAEVYGIFDYKSVPVPLLITLVTGLRADSRVMMAISGQSLKPNEFLMATIIDRLNLLLWTKTKDAEKGRNRPKSIIDNFTRNNDVSSFRNKEDFEIAKKKILGGT